MDGVVFHVSQPYNRTEKQFYLCFKFAREPLRFPNVVLPYVMIFGFRSADLRDDASKIMIHTIVFTQQSGSGLKKTLLSFWLVGFVSFWFFLTFKTEFFIYISLLLSNNKV